MTAPCIDDVCVTLDGSELLIHVNEPRPLLVLAVDPDSGEGGYLLVDAKPGGTRTSAPLLRGGVHVEVVDAATGAVYAQLVTPAA
ncbi:hypothetical protein RDV89_10870 [Nocardioides zeae]|uniref:Uncharacterized protein n=1 Tax=Nocardioides imazamoxiresistens TaxID=3231893 RepID=A0ABU3PXG7_9ACTN|nr:hypothetical protein [Nocardioides zeae]MDT9593571.1 hypothetical protein [Nocardioides zeae]